MKSYYQSIIQLHYTFKKFNLLESPEPNERAAAVVDGMMQMVSFIYGVDSDEIIADLETVENLPKRLK